MSNLCLICYANPLPNNKALKCGFKVWEFWLISWVKAEAKYEFIKAGDLSRSIEDAIAKQRKDNYSPIIENLKCVNNDWQKGNDIEWDDAPQDIKHRLTYEEVVEYVQYSERADYKENLDRILLDIITPSMQNFIKWPRQGWDYVGFVNINNKWSEQLEWEKWSYSWSDPNLDSLWKKLKKWWWSWNFNFSLLNNLQKVFRSQACPQWGIWIIKDKGCQHMICQGWKYEFWWYWLGSYSNYIHIDVLFCRFRSITKFFLYLYVILFTINLKFWILYKEYHEIWISVSEIVGFFLLSNLLVLSWLFEYIFIIIFENFRYKSGLLNSTLALIFKLISFLYPVAWLSGVITMLVIFKFVQKLAVFFWIELVSISVIIWAFLLIKWILKWVSSKIRQIRARRQYHLSLLESEEIKERQLLNNDYQYL